MKKESFWTRAPRVMGETPKDDIMPVCLLCSKMGRVRWKDVYSVFHLCITHSKDVSQRYVLPAIQATRLDKLLTKLESEKRFA